MHITHNNHCRRKQSIEDLWHLLWLMDEVEIKKSRKLNAVACWLHNPNYVEPLWDSQGRFTQWNQILFCTHAPFKTDEIPLFWAGKSVPWTSFYQLPGPDNEYRSGGELPKGVAIWKLKNVFKASCCGILLCQGNFTKCTRTTIPLQFWM